MTNLFPGMSVEEVLGSQAAHLARLQLDRVSESSPQAGIPQGIVGQVPQVGTLGQEREMAGGQDSSYPTASSGHSPAPGAGGLSLAGGLPSALGPWLGRQLRERERERHKARALQLRWKQEQPLAETSEELKATTPQTLEGKPEGPKEEAETPQKEEKQASVPHAGA